MSNQTDFLSGNILVIAPHMDDEILGCGGTVALLPDRRRVFVAYATDGRRIPGMRDAPPSGPGGRDPAATRADEAKSALATLGIPVENARFLAFSADDLRRRRHDLVSAIKRLFDEIRPASILVPFRYDQHRDHIILNAVGREVRADSARDSVLLEYFVYYRFRLLPGGDIRRAIRPEFLHTVDISSVAEIKRKALNCFESQVTAFCPGQKKAVLSPELIEAFAMGPELFVRWPASASAREVFSVSSGWVRFVHAVEPFLKWNKDRLMMALGT